MPARTLPRLIPISHTAATISDSFWRPRLDRNRTATIPIEYEMCRTTGRLDALKLKWKPDRPNRPHHFWDSDIAKWIEAAAGSLATHPDPKLERQVDDIVALYSKAQRKDGYLNSYFDTVSPEKRWTNLRDMHELYCAGHLMEAAVAYFQATGKRKFLDILCRYADHIAGTFGRGKGRKRGYPGHEEVELALVKMYRATGERRYLDLAAYFVNERGRRPLYFEVEARARGEAPSQNPACRYGIPYQQAHLPVRRQKTADGHAVRATYLYSGMTDVAVETGDRSLLRAAERLWENATRRRMYVTGAIGSGSFGEKFTFDYDLPNEMGYAETCANIGLAFWAHRMVQVERDSRYSDVMELALYNGIISGVSLDGKSFFYVNRLTSYPPAQAYEGEPNPGQRKDWFRCACCPPNVARLLASFGQYVYSQSPTEAWVHLYVQGRGRLDLGGRGVVLEQTTGYPWKERVRVAVRPEQGPMKFTLALRIPGWCRNPSIKINGRPADLKPLMKKGYAKIARLWRPGDSVELAFPMPVVELEANPRVRMDCGCVALQRGPVVYCIEEADNGPNLGDIALMPDAKFKAAYEPRLLGGVVTVSAQAVRRAPSAEDYLYRPAASAHRRIAVRAVPYCVWANRKPGEMRVWIGSSSVIELRKKNGIHRRARRGRRERKNSGSDWSYYDSSAFSATSAVILYLYEPP